MINDNCVSCIKFDHFEAFPPGKLPRTKTVLEYMIATKDKNNPNKSNDIKNAYITVHEIAMDIYLEWVFCNVYPQSCVNIRRKLNALFDEYTRLKDYVHTKKKIAYWNDYKKFIASLSRLFDVKGTDSEFI